MNRISSPIDQISERYDVIVIGSGYGGGIGASRMARAGRRVCLLERGREIVPGEYPNTMINAAEEFQMNTPEGHVGSRTGLFDFHLNAQQNVLVGCGLGGTSLINANVSLEAKPDVFDDPRWPAEIRADCDTRMQDGHARAREMLRPAPYPENGPILPKMEANQKSADFMGQRAAFYRPPINVTFEPFQDNKNHVGVEQLPCNNCGDCVSGCNNKAKNTTLMNYLPDAWNHGADIFCMTAVSHIEKVGDGWLVHYQSVGTGREKFDAPTLFVKADVVIVSAGTLGTTEIMLRSKKKGLKLSDQVGKNLSGNGDILGFGYNTGQEINGIGFGDSAPSQYGPVGPCITSIIDMREQEQIERRMVIEEGSIPGAIGKLMLPMLSASADLFGANGEFSFTNQTEQKKRVLNGLIRGPHHGAIRNTQTYLIMSHDEANGRMVLDGKDQLRIDWPNVGMAPNVEIGNARLADATKALAGTYVPNPIWNDLFKHSIVSVHPLGGCVMGGDAKQGVVNHKGQVFSDPSGTEVHAGLYIADGSVIPTSLAVNPLLTISALSERTMALLAKDKGWTIDYTLPSAPKKIISPEKLGIQFTETMKGYFATSFKQVTSTDLPIYEQAYQKGESDNSPMGFTLTVSSGDMEQLIADPKHQATMVGTLNAPALSPHPLSITHGVFNLFEVFPEQIGVRHMNYNMRLSAEDGTNYYFSAFKSVPSDHSALNVWHDTSTLYVTVYLGQDTTGEVFGLGVMHIEPLDFCKQMTTMKVSNAKNELERLEAVARFGKYFVGVLWESYGSVFAGDTYFNPEAPPRRKRALNVGAPQVHYFSTEDAVELRLTRYQGGTKGPVMLVHGAGVGSNIFSTDTISTNLLEYLYNHGYDVWLLDFRVSILLAASLQTSNGDQVAHYDFPAAIRNIQQESGAKDVQCVVHCYGATTFFMSLLAGLQGVRSVVCSQIATDLVVPNATAVKTGLHLPTVLDKLGVKSLSADTKGHSNWMEKLYDKALNTYSLVEAQGHCNNPVCHRVTFMYASLYRHDTLNETIHDNLHELFGVSNIATFEHLALMCREGKLVDAMGHDVYMPNMNRLSMPICFISGADNQCYLPRSTELTYERLCQEFGPANYSRHVVSGYAHIDCIFGKNAVLDVYPLILNHLEKSAAV